MKIDLCWSHYWHRAAWGLRGIKLTTIYLAFFFGITPNGLQCMNNFWAVAYRNIPIHPKDKIYLGMQWNGSIYVDMVLCFGLRSAPLLFSAVADGLLWISYVQKGWHSHIPLFGWLHYYWGTNIRWMFCNVVIMEDMYRECAISIEFDKSEGPTTTLILN